MDVGQTTKEVVLKLDATATPNVSREFDKAGASADRLNAKVGGISKGLRDLRTADRSLMGLGHGLMMISMTAGGANAKLQSTFSVLMGFHAAVQVFRGLAVSIDMVSRSLDGLGSKAVATRGAKGVAGLLVAKKAAEGSGADYLVSGAETAAAGAAARAMFTHPVAAGVITIVASTVILGSKGAADAAGNVWAHLPERNSGWGAALRVLPNIGIEAANYWLADKLGWGKRVPLLGEGPPGPFEKQELREQARQRQIEAFQTNLSNIGIEAPFRKRMRALGEVRAQSRDQANLLGVFGQDFVQREARTTKGNLQGELDRALGIQHGPVLQRLLEGAGGVHFQEQREKAVELAQTMAERKAAVNTKELLAQRELDRAVSQRDTLAGRMRGFQRNAQAMIANGNQPNLAEQKRLEDELAAATQRTFEAQQKYNNALKSSKEAIVENLQTFKGFAQENQRFYRNIRMQEEERQRGFKAQWGLMNPMEQQAALTIAEKLAKGPGKDQGPQVIQGPGGKWMAIPGTAGGLTQQEMQMARSMPGLSDALERYGRQRAENDPNWDKYLKASGLDVKRQQAEQAEKLFANIAVKMENKIQAEIKINEEALAEQLRKLIPDIVQAQQQAKDAMVAELARQNMVRSSQQQAALGK